MTNYNLDKIPGLRRANPLKELTNIDNIAEGVRECLKNDDYEGVMEVLDAYYEALNIIKSKRLSNKVKKTASKKKQQRTRRKKHTQKSLYTQENSKVG